MAGDLFALDQADCNVYFVCEGVSEIVRLMQVMQLVPLEFKAISLTNAKSRAGK